MFCLAASELLCDSSTNQQSKQIDLISASLCLVDRVEPGDKV